MKYQIVKNELNQYRIRQKSKVSPYWVWSEDGSIPSFNSSEVTLPSINKVFFDSKEEAMEQIKKYKDENKKAKKIGTWIKVFFTLGLKNND